MPQDQPGPEGTSEGIGPSQRAGQTSLADWAEETLGPLAPDPSPGGSLQAWEPLPPLSHPSGVPVLSSLHFSSPLSPPTSYRFTWGFFLFPWALGSPTSVQQVPSQIDFFIYSTEFLFNIPNRNSVPIKQSFPIPRSM